LKLVTEHVETITSENFLILFRRKRERQQKMSRSLNLVRQHLEQDHNTKVAQSSVARNFKTCVNVPHVNKTVTDFFGGRGVYLPI